jgi:hypothetical protein
LSVAPQNRREDEDGAGHTSRSSGLLHVEASRVRIYQFASKLVGTSGGRDTIAAASEDQVKDRRVDVTSASDPATFTLLFFMY